MPVLKPTQHARRLTDRWTRGLVFAHTFGGLMPDHVAGRAMTISGCTFTAGQRGRRLKHNSTNNFADFGTSNFLPTLATTVLLGYRKTDATNRSSFAFCLVSDTPDHTARFSVTLPWSDGNVYWDFNEISNRLTVTGLTFGDDVWCFTAGQRGREVWQNGILRGSNATKAVARTASTVNFRLGNSVSPADLAEVDFMFIWGEQLPTTMIQQLSGDPMLPLRRLGRMA